MQIAPNKKKREYSKGGCRECKRRKIKCSEEKPECIQCTRLDKVCNYPVAGEKVLRISRKQQRNLQYLKSLEEQKIRIDSLKEIPGETVYYQGAKNDVESGPIIINRPENNEQNERMINSDYNSIPLTKNQNEFSDKIINVSSNYNTQYLPNISLLDIERSSKISNILQNPFLNINNSGTKKLCWNSSNFFDDTIISLNQSNTFYQRELDFLMHDLNSFAKNILYELNIDNDILAKNENNSNFGIDNGWEIKPFFGEEFNIFPRNIPFNHIEVSGFHEKLYLEYFYKEYSQTILPFQCYEKLSKNTFNPAKDLILSFAAKVPFLLALILAQGAKIAFMKNHLQEDFKFHRDYLWKFSKLCTSSISGISKGKNDPNSQEKLELILITILLLSSEYLSDGKELHQYLGGAKNFLLKTDTSKIHKPNIIIFCKAWLVALVISAGLDLNIADSLVHNYDVDALLTNIYDHETKILKEIGVIHDSGFNILCGFKNDNILLFKDLIKTVSSIRLSRNKPDIVSNNSLNYLQLLSEFYKQLKLDIFVNDNTSCPLSCRDNETIYNYSIENWMDITQKAHVLAAIIIILKECIQTSYQSNVIQDLSEKLINLLSFLNYTTEITKAMSGWIILMQWPMLVAGLNCTQEKSRYLLVKFFRHSAELGYKRAEFSLKKIYRSWDSQ